MKSAQTCSQQDAIKMKTTLSVFLCSTYNDLIEERSKVLGAITKLKLQNATIEFFGARSNQPIETCLDEVRQSDILVVIVGYLYGSIVPEMDISFTEAEYNEAIRLGKPCLVYFRSENIPILPRYFEQDPGRIEALRRFKEHLQTNHTVAVFENSTELSERIVQDLTRVLGAFSEAKKAEKDLKEWVDDQQGQNEKVERFVQEASLEDPGQFGVLQQLTTKPFYVAPSRSFLAYFSDLNEDGSCLVLLTTSDALGRGLSAEDMRLVAGLLSRMASPGVMSRVAEELKQKEIYAAWMQKLKKENDPLSEALPYLYVPTIQSGDTTIAFPEDDFLDERGFSSEEDFEQAMRTSKLKEICPYIHGWRCGLPKTFCNQLLESFS